MLRILEAQFIGYFADCFLCCDELLFGGIYYFILYVFLCRFAGFLLYQVSKVIRRKIYLVGKIFHRRQSFRLRLPALEIRVEQRFKPGKYIFVGFCASDKLTVVKAHTVV